MGSLTYLDENGNWVTSPDGSNGGTELTDGIIETRYLADKAVTEIKIADGAVSNAKISSVDGSKIIGEINGTIIAEHSMPPSKLALGSIDSSYLTSELKKTIDDAYVIANEKNSTFYQTSMPTGTHKNGDLWFDTDDGYRIYVYSNGVWEDSQGRGINDAIELAAGKNKTYYQAEQPSSTNDGDIWFDTDDGNKPYVMKNNLWVSAQDLSVKNMAQQAIDSADGKNKNYYQPDMPSGGSYKPGDAWYDTDDGNKLYVFDGAVWKNMSDGRFDTIVTELGNKVYYQDTQPTGRVFIKGDIWFDTSHNYRQYVYTGSIWQVAQDSYYVQTTVMTAVNGKNKIVYSQDSPSGSGFVAGDTWYKTSGSGAVDAWKYNGTSWDSYIIAESMLGNISANKITASWLEAGNIKAGTIVGSMIAANTVTASNMVVGTITADSGVIAEAAIGTANIKDAAITNAKIANIDAAKITTGYLDANIIKAGTITGQHIAANTVSASNMVTGTITAESGIIANAAIVTANIKDLAVTNAKMADLSVTNAKIADLAVTNAKINDLNASKITAGYIAAARIEAASITTDKMLVGTGSNIFKDYKIQSSEFWTSGFSSSGGRSGTGFGSISIPSGTAVRTVTQDQDIRKLTDVQSDISYQVAAWIKTSAVAQAGSISIVCTGTDATLASSVELGSIHNDGDTDIDEWTRVVGIITIPSGVTLLKIGFSANSTYSGSVVVSEPSVINLLDPALVVRGSITADMMRAGTITASSGIIANIDASTITTGVLDAKRISVVPVEKLSGRIDKSQLNNDVIGTINSVAGKADQSSLDTLSDDYYEAKTGMQVLMDAINVTSTGMQNVINIDADTGITVAQQNAKLAINIGADSIKFWDSGAVAATITGQVMTIKNVTIGTEMIIGRHSITQSGNQTVFRVIK